MKQAFTKLFGVIALIGLFSISIPAFADHARFCSAYPSLHGSPVMCDGQLFEVDNHYFVANVGQYHNGATFIGGYWGAYSHYMTIGRNDPNIRSEAILKRNVHAMLHHADEYWPY
jgi:hypothetical protein